MTCYTEGGVERECSFAWDTWLDLSIEKEGPILWTQAVRSTWPILFSTLPAHPASLSFFYLLLKSISANEKILIMFFLIKKAKALVICFNTNKCTKVTHNQAFPDWCTKMLFCQVLPCIYDVRILLCYSFLLFSHADHRDLCWSLCMYMAIESSFNLSKSFSEAYKKFVHYISKQKTFLSEERSSLIYL